MSGEIKRDDIVQRLSSAAKEAEAIKEEIMRSGSESYDRIANSFAANYQLIMDEVEQEIADEYRSSGTLTGARVCEINRGVDDYALSVHDVMTLLDTLKDGE